MSRVTAVSEDDKAGRIVAAATKVFLRYGYRRVTMADLAGAAGMSRPALYLVYPSKEVIFTAVLARVFAEVLGEIRQGLGHFVAPRDKLTFAVEVWCVHPFELIQASPDARDVLESGYEFATEVTTRAAADFVGILADILDPLVQKQAAVHLSAVEIAELLANALPGFKQSSNNAAQLRQTIADLLTLVLASLRTT